LKITLDQIFKELPKPIVFEKGIRRAPKRDFSLTKEETKLALKNALR
jgi:urocanate hydratase